MTQIRIVIAEDDPQIAEIQHRFVSRIPYCEVVGIAHSTQDAEEMVEVLKPQLLLLDIQFPLGNGLELLRTLRSQQSAVDVILITAAKEVDTLTEALRYGVFDYILKPLVFDRLEKTLEAYRQHLDKLQRLQSLDQRTVDGLMPRSHGGGSDTTPTLPKGIDGLTLDKIRQVFQAESGSSLSAEQAGEQVGTSRTTARRYLEYLVTIGELEADVAYGSVGRPERRYRLRRN